MTGPPSGEDGLKTGAEGAKSLRQKDRGGDIMESNVIVLGQCYQDETLQTKVQCENCATCECILHPAND